MRYPPHAFSERVESGLGNPNDPTRPFSYARSAVLDEREEFPVEICRELDRLGLPRYYVPVRYGGALDSFEDLLQLIRIVGRRDFTAALAHAKTYLGAVATWVAGEPGQAARLAERVIGGGVVSLALTEPEHGSDLLAGEVTAVPAGGGPIGGGPGAGYRISGEKWLINNATRADVVCVLARTDPAGGARGFSLLLVDKHELGPDGYRHLPRVRTHGVRGADISGIAFNGAEVGPEAMVGAPGTGLETVLRSFQITRTLCAGMSLGLADHALRLATGFAAGHRMYGRQLVDLPHAHRTLAEAYADLLIAEATSLVATRSIHTLTGELSVTSAIVKYLVPTDLDQTITRLGQVLGARALFTGAHAHGRFQKVERDHRVVGIFDGNTLVNLNSLINQFATLVRGYRRGTVEEAGLAGAAALGDPPPPFDPARLTLRARTGCSVVQSLPSSVREIQALSAAGVVPAGLAAYAGELLKITDELHDRMAGYRPSARDVPTEAFELARRYTRCFAAAACMRLWLANRTAVTAGSTAGLWADGRWLEACLARLLGQFTPGHVGDDAAVLDQLVPHLREQYRDGLLFSLLPCRLAEDTHDRSDDRSGDRSDD